MSSSTSMTTFLFMDKHGGLCKKVVQEALKVAQVEPTCTQRPVGEDEAGKRAALEARCSRQVAGVRVFK